MKNSILFFVVFLLTPFSNIFSQAEKSDFFLKFETIQKWEEDGKLKAYASLNHYDIGIDENAIGQIMPLYHSTNQREVEFIGKVKLDTDNDHVIDRGFNIVKIELEDNPKNHELLDKNSGLVKIEMSVDIPVVRDLVFHMDRLSISMFDVHGEEDLLSGMATGYEKKSEESFESYILRILVDESGYVAGAMREQMDSPPVTEGRFKGKDLFTAMEYVDENDVKSFLRFVKEFPYKYQGVEWKFSEIFATWIIEGSPTVITDYQSILLESEHASNFRYFKGINSNECDKVLERVISISGDEIDSENLDRASRILDNAEEIASEFENGNRLAWINYRKGRILNKKELNHEANTEFQLAMDWFVANKDKSGIVVVGNDYGDNLNDLGDKKSYGKALEILNIAVGETSDFSKEDEVLAPMVSLLYRNLGDSYVGLKKYKKALGIYEKGLEYTHVNTTKAIKRRAAIELRISELYTMMKKDDLAQEYADKAVSTYLEYEEKAAKIHKL